MAGGVADVVACLPSKHEALSSNSNTTIKKKKKERKKLKGTAVSLSLKSLPNRFVDSHIRNAHEMWRFYKTLPNKQRKTKVYFFYEA
jgi:hypothetical protein